jgi:hypothetical protein
MTTLTLIAVRLAEEVLAVSARDRWHGMHSVQKANLAFPHSVWFIVTIVLLVAGAVIAIIALSLYNRLSQRKIAERAFAQNVSRKQLTPAETSILELIAERAGLEKAVNIFLMPDAFTRGAEMLIKETLIRGNPTNETAPMENHVAVLRKKMGYRYAAGGAYHSIDSGTKSEKNGTDGPRGSKEVLVTLFPFSGNPDLSDGKENPEQGDLPPDWRGQLQEFVSAKITGLVGRVVFIETALQVNVGDRILVAIGFDAGKEDSETAESIESIGTVEQILDSTEPVEISQARRMSVNFAHLTESQMLRLAQAINNQEGQNAAEQSLTAETERVK